MIGIEHDAAVLDAWTERSNNYRFLRRVRKMEKINREDLAKMNFAGGASSSSISSSLTNITINASISKGNGKAPAFAISVT